MLPAPIPDKALGSVDSSWQIASMAAFNGDFKSDILWRNSNGTIGLWESNASGPIPIKLSAPSTAAGR